MRWVTLLVMLGGCTTVTPHGKAVQTAAYGGGFMAAGTLSVVTASVGFGTAAAAIAVNDEIPNGAKEDLIMQGMPQAVSAVVVGVVVFAVGAMVMHSTTGQLDKTPERQQKPPREPTQDDEE
jgi:amino acid transporter